MAIRSAVLRDLVRGGLLRTSHVTSKEQLADGLTKFLPGPAHAEAVRGWCLQSVKKMSMQNEIEDVDPDDIKDEKNVDDEKKIKDKDTKQD